MRKKSTTGKKCKCSKKNPRDVHTCAVTSSSDGVSTVLTIKVCTQKKFLNAGECKATCPSGKTSYGVRTTFRSCEEPLTCDQESSGIPLVQGLPCACEDPRIAVCKWNADNQIVTANNGIHRRSTEVSEIVKCMPGFVYKTKTGAAGDTHWCGKK